MTQQDVPTISQSVEIDAPVAKVWSLVSDPRHMTRWSPQTWKTFLRGGGQLGEGARFFNINKRGLLVWPTQSKVVRFTPEQEVAWRVKDNYTIWSLKLTPNATGGTTLSPAAERARACAIAASYWASSSASARPPRSPGRRPQGPPGRRPPPPGPPRGRRAPVAATSGRPHARSVASPPRA